MALVAAEPAATETESILRTGAAGVVVTNLAETIDVLLRVHAVAGKDVEDVIRPLVETTLTVRSPRAEDAWRVAELRRRHYVLGSSELSLADCFLLASARDDDSIATADPPLAQAARMEGIAVVALPDRAGSRP